VPVFVKVTLNVPPEALNVPLFHRPASLVVVCDDGPVFVHWTVVPTFTVSMDGENVKSRIDTLCPLLGAVVLLLQAATARPRTRARA
jgi:hypothetical protein